MSKATQLKLAGLFFTAMASSASAGSIDAVTLLNQYNLITSGNVTSYSEVDGNALIGGNVTGGMYNMHQTSNAAVASLTVGGDVYDHVQTKGQGLHVGGNVAGHVNINDGGNAYVGSVSGGLNNNANGRGSTNVIGDISGNVNTNGGNTTYGGNLTGSANANGGGTVTNQSISAPVDPAQQANAAIATLGQFSNQLSGLEANSSYAFNGSKVTFNAFGNDAGLAIFNIADATSFFSSAFEFDFTFNNTESVLFNVFGGSDSILNIQTNFLASAATIWGSTFLWNFVDASTINFATQFGGSILALGADVTNRGNLEGTLVASSLTQYAEIHSQPINFVPPAAVPVPAALPLFLGGMIGLFSFLRHQRKKAAAEI